jgi:hypothetical protein
VRGGYIVVSVVAGETEYLVLERSTGAPPALPESRCSVNVPDNSRPRLAPDGSMIAWQTPEGVMVSPTPSQSGGTETLCQLTPKLVAAGGSEPDWGTADVPADPAPGGDGGAGGGNGGAGGAKLTTVAAPKLGKALAKGFAVGFRCAGPCRVSATATVAKGVARRYGLGRGKAKVGTGSARLAKAGAGRARVAFTAKARRKLAAARRLAVTVVLTVTDPGGHRRKLSRVVTLRQ